MSTSPAGAAQTAPRNGSLRVVTMSVTSQGYRKEYGTCVQRPSDGRPGGQTMGQTHTHGGTGCGGHVHIFEFGAGPFT